MARSDAWRQRQLPPEFLQTWVRNMNGVAPPIAMLHPDGRLALIGREPVAKDDMRWHLSVRWADPKTDVGRVPTWEEMVKTCHELRPGVPFVVGIPPQSWWMNVHPHVLHAWETTDKYLLEQWRKERMGQQPT